MAKWLSVRLRTKWFWVRVQLQSHRSNVRYQRTRASAMAKEGTGANTIPTLYTETEEEGMKIDNELSDLS